MLNNKLDRSAGFGVVGVVVIVLAIGFIGWRVYDANQKPKANTSTPISSEAQDAPLMGGPTQDPNVGYVVISQWGVRFKPAESLGEVQYFKPKDLSSYDAFTFTTKGLSDAATTCSASSENIVLGLLYRNKEQLPQYGSLLAKIGDYYYQYRGPQASCGSDDIAMESAALIQLSESLKSLEAAK